MHFFPYTLEFGQENRIFATRSVLRPKTCRKCDSGRGSAPDPAGGAHDAPPDPLVGWGGGHLSPYPTPLGAFGASMLAPSAPRSSCPLTPNPGDATTLTTTFKVKLRLCLEVNKMNYNRTNNTAHRHEGS